MDKLIKKKKLISVIVPTFNSEGTILSTIKSIFEQKIIYDIEIIIIDDNSMDKTIKLVKSIKIKPNFKIKIIKNKKNMGSGYSRKIGIKKSRGYYIAFLDSDDFWLENKLINQIKFMESIPNAVFTYSDFLEERTIKGKLMYFLIRTPKKVTLKKNKFINRIPNSSVLLLSKIAKQVKYPENRLRNDFIYWNKILTLNKKIFAHNFHPGKPYFIYGSNPGISNNKFKLVFKQWLVYRNSFKFSYLESVYGLIINIISSNIKKIFSERY